jgi:hypothetical protein
MSKLKISEFHKPFIKDLVLVMLVTMVTMISTRYFIINYINKGISPPVFSEQKSYIHTDSSLLQHKE